MAWCVVSVVSDNLEKKEVGEDSVSEK